VRGDGSQVILKLGMPHPELSSEIAALRLYDGHGIAQLIEADPERGALLIERLLPGGMLLDLTDDDAATRIAAGIESVAFERKVWGVDLPDQLTSPGSFQRETIPQGSVRHSERG
jgi:streptomycin 6-kinase